MPKHSECCPTPERRLPPSRHGEFRSGGVRTATPRWSRTCNSRPAREPSSRARAGASGSTSRAVSTISAGGCAVELASITGVTAPERSTPRRARQFHVRSVGISTERTASKPARRYLRVGTATMPWPARTHGGRPGRRHHGAGGRRHRIIGARPPRRPRQAPTVGRLSISVPT